MNTSSLQWLKQRMTTYKKLVEKASVPDANEWQRESEIGLTEVMISEIDREIESNRKRSERTKRCIRKKQWRF